MKKINDKLAFGIVFILLLDLLALTNMVIKKNLFHEEYTWIIMLVGLIISGFIGKFMSNGYNPDDNYDLIFTGVLITLGFILIYYLIKIS